jgi:hypothetical protein
MSRVIEVGRCGVDSGQIMIVDPCYVIDNEFGEAEYEECCRATLDTEDNAGPIMRNLAVVASSGIGDGYYPVYATIEDLGGWGERIVKLEIDFSDHVLLGPVEYEECQRCGDAPEEGEEHCWRCAEHLENIEADNDNGNDDEEEE